MTDSEQSSEAPSTWENVVVGKAKEALGHAAGEPDLVDEGEAQEEIAHEVHDEYRHESDNDDAD